MFVKRLELVGFKSFADRSELVIAPGVTAVMGPNGSGKSNIADAIRWVLGEQSVRLLRGAKLEDVIFAGSDARKPVNYAEVRLLLDNADHVLPVDFAEVSVARRVYRSGESEFFINQTACRLRDIGELFMDTGMGREAYSVIGQGRIEEILSNKPEDRRGIFEEAAGIVKFRVRRKEAEKKLGEADQNLLRVRDLIAELSRQLEPLERRSQVAQAYKELLQEFERLSVSLIAAEFDAILEKKRQFGARVIDVGREVDSSSSQEKTAEEGLIDLRVALEERERVLQRVQADRLDATAKVEKNEGDLRVHEERRLHYEEQRRESERQVLSAEEDASRTQVELEAMAKRKAELARTAAELREQVRQYQEARSGKSQLQSLRGQLAEARSQMIERMRNQATKRNDLHNAEQELAQQLRRLDRVRGELAVVEEEVMRLQRARDTIAAEGRATRERLLGLAQEKKRLLDALQSAQQAQQEAGRDVRSVETTRLELRSRLRALQGMHEARQGFASGPRAILQAAEKNHLAGVVGAVADLFKVEKDWETAVETALGGSLQNVVIDTEASARACIAYLKKNNLGRATFLPLSVMIARTLPSGERKLAATHAGFVGLASELVTVELKLLRIAENLLGQVVVVVDLTSANEVAASLHQRYRVVTKDGDVVHPGGSMTGGSQSKRGTGLLALGRELEDAQGELAAAERKWREAADRFEALEKTLQAAQAQWRQHEEREQGLERSLREYELEWRSLEAAYGKQVDAAAGLRGQLEQTESERAATLTSKDALLQVVADIEAQAACAEAEMLALERQIAEEEARQEEGKDEWTEWRVRLAETEEALRSAGTDQTRLGNERAAILARRDEYRNAIVAWQERLEAHHAQGMKLAAERVELRLALEQVEAEQAGALAERQARADAYADAEKRVHAVREQRRKKEAEMHELQLALGKYAVELDAKENELREKHGLGIELARARFPLDQSLAEAKRRLADLRDEMRRYEGVNLGDIEEYERLRERHQFLFEQEEDLQQAQAQLRKLIADMDVEMGKRFSETFANIRASFQEVFAELFGGGRADLRMEGEGDPLRDGIDILAEPPGKRLQMLSLLSGGERALTALALLFAILKVKPVPFCVLDEVEAALDEVNVVRFAEFLKQFAANTQFIVITHRRGTMEKADVLYGVTMQVTGVSKLVSVRVIEEDPVTA